jgi:hypothetical protein
MSGPRNRPRTSAEIGADRLRTGRPMQFGCARGHPWTRLEDVYTRPDGRRECRPCKKMRG